MIRKRRYDSYENKYDQHDYEMENYRSELENEEEGKAQMEYQRGKKIFRDFLRKN